MKPVFPLALVILLFSASAHAETSMMQAGTAFMKGDYATALKIWQPMADNGDADAQYELGNIYEKGLGVPVDLKQAAKWYRKAGLQDQVYAAYNLGRFLQAGRGVPRDYVTARSFYHRAAQKGYAPAQARLGMLFDKGLGMKHPDYDSAAMWEKKSADQNDPDGQNFLGVLYIEGHGVGQSHEEAAKLFRKAADQGSADAQYNLGCAYAAGEGVQKDGAEAYFWFSLAANQQQKDAAAARDKAADDLSSSAKEDADKRVKDWKAVSHDAPAAPVAPPPAPAPAATKP